MPKIAAKDRDAFFAKRRSELLDAAFRLLTSRSYDGVPVAAIAEEAGLSKGTFYVYFESKEQLLLELVRRHTVLPDLEAMRLGGFAIENAVRMFVPMIWQRVKANSDLMALLLREATTRPKTAELFLENVILPVNRAIAEAVAEGIGEARAKAVDPFVAARCLVGMVMVFGLTQQVFGGAELRPIDDEAITSTIAEVFLYGIRGSGDREVGRP